MKIKILYSHINTPEGQEIKNRPNWFNYEKCFINFLSTIPGMELHIIYDNTRGSLENNWINNYQNFGTIHQIQGGSMMKAAQEMYKIAKELSSDMEDGDLFYFLENDYLHTPDWINKVTNLYETYKLDGGYVSLYDHPDKYFEQVYPNLFCQLLATETHHWRNTPSTCGSYIVNKKTFLEDYDIHSGLEGDHNKWLYLTETKQRFVLTPIPSLSTHCMEGLLAPTIDWKRIDK